MRHGSLFSGIGGFDLASEWVGWENVFHCEWNKFGQRVLKYHWPNAISYDDITKTDFTIHRGQIDILTGGFPCQPYSSAGKRKGKEDDRHLWPEMLRAIREIQPSYVVGENVRGLTNWNGGVVFDEVQTDLEAEGYEVTPFLLPACAVNAPHRRDRIWFVAYAGGDGFSGDNQSKNGQQYDGEGETRGKSLSHDGSRPATDTSRPGLQKSSCGELRSVRETKGTLQGSELSGTYAKGDGWQNFPTQPPVRSGDDGLSDRLDGITFPKWRNESIKAYGNAIVPQVVYQIFKAIEEYEKRN